MMEKLFCDWCGDEIVFATFFYSKKVKGDFCSTQCRDEKEAKEVNDREEGKDK